MESQPVPQNKGNSLSNQKRKENTTQLCDTLALMSVCEEIPCHLQEEDEIKKVEKEEQIGKIQKNAAYIA